MLRIEFTGILKNGKKATEISTGLTERECRTKISKKYRTFTSVVRIADVIGEEDIAQVA